MRAGGIGEGRGGGFVNGQIHTHTYTRITNYTKISLVGVCVHVCIVARGQGEKKTYSKQNGGGKQSFPPSLCEKSAL